MKKLMRIYLNYPARIILISTLIVTIIFPVASFAGTATPITPRLVRPLGMGGAFAAVSDDANALFYNPAGLATAKQWHITLPIVADTTQSTIDLVSWVIDNSNRLGGGDFSKWTQSDIDRFASTNVKVGFNTGINASFQPIAFGVYGIANSRIELSTLGLLPQAILNINLDIVIPVAYAKQLDFEGLNEFFDQNLGGGRLSAGITLKYIQRRSIKETRSALDFTSINPNDYLTKLSTAAHGLGFDLGLLYEVPSISSSFAIAIQDLYTSIGGDLVKGSFDIGYAYKPDWDLGLVNNFIFAFDIDSINDGDLTFFNKIHMGVEAQLISIIALRLGLYQGYPGFGLGLSLLILRFDYVNHAVEKGRFPGQIEERQHTFALNFAF